MQLPIYKKSRFFTFFGDDGFNPASLGATYFQAQGGSKEGNTLFSKTGDDTRDLQPRYVRHLNGTIQYGVVPDNAAFDITDNLTVIVVAKNDDTSIAAATEYLVAKYDINNEREWALRFDSDETLTVTYGGATGAFVGTVKAATPSDVENKNIYAFSFEAGVTELYVNKTQLGKQAGTGTPPSVLYNGTANLSIGSLLSSGVGGTEWDGIIFEVIIFKGDSTVLTPEQISDINDSLVANPTKNIQDTVYGLAGQTVVEHWKLDENTGDVFYGAANGLNGTWQNSPTIETTTEDVSNYPNRVGYSEYMNFDGVDDNILFPSLARQTGVTMQASVNTVDTQGVLFADNTDSGNDGWAILWQNGSSSGAVASGVVYDSVLVDNVVISPLTRDSLYQAVSDGRTHVVKITGVDMSGDKFGGGLRVGDLQHTTTFRASGSIFDVKMFNSANDLIQHNQGYGNTDAAWLDQVGLNNGTVNGSPETIFIPRNESDVTKDVFGNPLQNTGKAKSRAIKRDNNCIVLNGTTQYGLIVDDSTLKVNDFIWRGTAQKQTNGAFQYLQSIGFQVAGGAGIAGFGLRFTNTDTLQTLVSNGSSFDADVSTATFTDTTAYYDVIAIKNGTSLKVYVDYVLVIDATVSATIDYVSATDQQTVVGAGLSNSSFANPINGKLFNLQYAAYSAENETKVLAGEDMDADLFDIPISEGSGDYSYSTDYETSGIKITWVNAPTWGNQDVYASNWLNGFNKYAVFNGTNYSVDTNVPPAIVSNDKDYTISIRAVSSDIEYLMAVGDALSPYSSMFIVGLGNGNIFWNNGTGFGATTTTYNDGEPHMFTYVVAGATNTAKGYVDGVYVGQVTAPQTTATTNVIIGSRGSQDVSFNKGKTYDFYAYNRQLTDAEILTLWENPATEQVSDGLVTHQLGYGATPWADTQGNYNGVASGTASSVRIPANGTTDAFGQPIRNLPVLGHNDAEETLDYINTGVGGVAIPETAFLSDMTADLSAFEFNQDISSDDNMFYKHETYADTKHTIYLEDLTGSDITKAEEKIGNGGK